MKKEFSEVKITSYTPLDEVEKLGSYCEKCGHCCSFGSGFFLAEDVRRIAKAMNMKKDDFIKEFLEETESFNTKLHKAKTIKENNKPYGKCTFYSKENGCEIHEIKPLHCKVGKGCGEEGEHISVWFALNYLVNVNDPESIRQWAVYLHDNPTIPGGELLDLVKDKEKLQKILSYEILRGE